MAEVVKDGTGAVVLTDPPVPPATGYPGNALPVVIVGGGGGGSSTTAVAPGFTEIVSDTANVPASFPIGAQTDAAYGGTGSGSLVAILKGLYTLNAGVMAVRPQLGTNPTTAQVSVGTAAPGTQILAATASTTPREIKNTGTATVFIGATGVTITTGHALLANESFTPWWTGAVFGIVATGTATVTTCV